MQDDVLTFDPSEMFSFDFTLDFTAEHGGNLDGLKSGGSKKKKTTRVIFHFGLEAKRAKRKVRGI